MTAVRTSSVPALQPLMSDNELDNEEIPALQPDNELDNEESRYTLPLLFFQSPMTAVRTTSVPAFQSLMSDNELDNEEGHVSVLSEKIESEPFASGPRIHDTLLLFCIFIMLVLPWVFISVVGAKNGIQSSNRIARAITNYPRTSIFVVTFICSIIAIVVNTLFSLAVIRFAQELVSNRKSVRPFYLGILLALSYQTWPRAKVWWDVKYLMALKRWRLTILLILCLVTFPQLVSIIASLITPISFKRTASLSGTELDFTSNSPACLKWFTANQLNPSVCYWTAFKNLSASQCVGQAQMVDAMEAGRSNILGLVSNDSQILSFNHLSPANGIPRFLGRFRGVIPLGPNGISVLDTLRPSPLSNPEILAGISSYNYTLHQQGLFSNITCTRQPTSAIITPEINEYHGSCYRTGEFYVLNDIDYLHMPLNHNALLYWACQSLSNLNGSQIPSYSIYLAGYGVEGYATTLQNITCRLSPFQPRILPVTYESTRRTFSTGDAEVSANFSGTDPPSVFSSFLAVYLLSALANIVSSAQTFDSNRFAEEAISYGVEFLGLKPSLASDADLVVFERMIQGILEYEMSYLRMLYSITNPNPDPTCVRTVAGSVSYEVIGWSVRLSSVFFLIPWTLINGAALVILIFALSFAKKTGYLDHQYSRPVTYDPQFGDETPDEWRDRVGF